MSALATVPTSTWSRCGKKSAAKIVVSPSTRMIVAITRRPKSCRVKAAISSRRWVSIGCLSGTALARRGVVGGEVGRGEGPGDQLADVLAVGPAAGLRAEPAHDLAHVTRRARAGRGNGLGDERLDLVVGQLLGKVFGQDRDLRLFLGDEVLAAALAERVDRLAASLDLPGDDGRVVVLTERSLLALLDVVGRALGHPQDIAAQRITGPHRGRNVGLDPITKGHRNGSSGGGWFDRRGIHDPRDLRFSRSFAAGTPWGCVSSNRADHKGRRSAQPTAVRAFFLRFASLRFRFTLGFS